MVDDEDKEQNYLQLISSTHREKENTKSFSDPEGLLQFGSPSLDLFYFSMWER